MALNSSQRILLTLAYLASLVGWHLTCKVFYAQSATEAAAAEAAHANAIDTARAMRVAAARATTSGAATTAAATAAPATAAPATARPRVAEAAAPSAGDAGCPGRKPFHTLLTAQATIYQQWQSRIMYYHWKKQKARQGACGAMGGFTRLVASEKGEADGLEDEMPSYFVPQLSTEVLAAHGHFGVLNRPHSVKLMVERGALARVAEQFVYVAETDHVFMRPMPNLATEETPAAYSFGYMGASASVQPIVEKHSPGTSWRDIQPIGPSPIIISKDKLATLTPLWHDLSFSLKKDPTADRRFGWVLEMWGYSIACAQLGYKHKVTREFQIEPGAGGRLSGEQIIYHYTYGIEYTMKGRPQGPNQIGEWSLDKRHYGGAYPPRHLRPPPDGASENARWLLDAFNEASSNIPTWPASKALGTVGWRRTRGDGIDTSALAARVMGTRWTWSGIEALEFRAAGELKTPWGSGVWGALARAAPDAAAGRAAAEADDFCAGENGCLFADFSGALHNVRFDFGATPHTFKTERVGDGESVEGKLLGA